MTYPRKRAELFSAKFLQTLLFILTALFATNAMAQAPIKPVRIVVWDVPEGGTERLLTELQTIDNVDIRDSAWFLGQVKGRGFRTETILEKPSDIRWVMKGSDIDWLVKVDLNEEETGYIAHFIEPESGQPRKSIPVDISESGLSAAGASLIRLETERIIGPGAKMVDNTSAGGGSIEGEEDLPADDPEAVRAKAAQKKQDVMARLARDWLWLRGGFRLIGKDVLVAGGDSTYVYPSSMMPGVELDVEAYPLALSNPEFAAAGMYVNYYHGFEGVVLELDNGDELSLPINHFGIEGGVIYRIDSPFEGTSSLTDKQMRLKIGVRYTASSVGENDEIPAISMVSIVVGARLVFPVGMPGLAMWANADLVPAAFAGSQAELYGQASQSYGFGTELGFLYEFSRGLGGAVGYGFQMLRTIYAGEGILDGFEDSLAYELVQGLRISFVYQY